MYDIRSKNLPWLNKVIDSIENAEKVVNPPQNPMTRKFKILFEKVSLKWLEVSLNIIPAINTITPFILSISNTTYNGRGYLWN